MGDESLASREDAGASRPDAPLAGDVAAAPLPRGERISSLDVLRGVAVLGILLMNIVGWGMPHWCYNNPGVIEGDAEGLSLWTWITTTMLFEGTMRAMFSMLFGAGVILLTSRLEMRWRDSGPQSLSVADIYYRRNLWLILFGMFHSYVMLWLGDVLFLYGLVGLFLYPFRRMSPRGLIVMSLLMFVVVESTYQYDRLQTLRLSEQAMEAQLAQAAGATLTDEQEDAIDDWQKKVEKFEPDAASVAEEIEWTRKGYVPLFLGLAPYSAKLESKDIYKNGFWDAAGMMLLGMALLKMGVLSGSRTRAVYWGMLIVGYAIGLSVNARETLIMMQGEYSVESLARAEITYDIGRVAMVFGHVGLIMLVMQAGVLRGLSARLAACGQMALTNYLMQSLICGFIFNGYGLGAIGRLERWQLYLVVLGIWLLQLIVSPIWLRRFQFGPAEWLWRSLTYWKRQPMRR